MNKIAQQNKKTLLIAGGTGLIGKELGKALVKKGYRIFVLTRSPKSSLLNTPYPHEPLLWEDLESEKGAKVFRQLCAIINLAGAGVANKKWTKKYKKELRRSRIERTRQLVSACRRHPHQIQCFLSASAIGYYGERINAAYEGDKKGSGFLPSLCQDWEEAVQKLSIRWVIFRIGAVFSEKGGFLGRIGPIIQTGLGGPVAGGQQLVSWIDREDLVSMFLFALESNISGVFNCVSPHPTTNAQITQAIARRYRTKAVFPVPTLLPRILFGEMSQLITMSQNISSDKIQQVGFQFQNPHWETSLRKRIPELKRTERRLVFEQWVPVKREVIFSFLSHPGNIKKLIPPDLKIKILSSFWKEIKQNTVIKSELSFYRLPFCWTVTISQWNPGESFTNTQTKGPFSKWIHQHSFETMGKGTLITDTIYYAPPLGIFGWLITGWKIEKIIQKIFKYRRQALFSLNHSKTPLNIMKHLS